jgi:hypothetical protein
VWASRGTEAVVWVIGIERWNSSTGRWYAYANFQRTAYFNIYGQNVSGWSGYNFVNSTMNLPVSHVGYYRMASAIGGAQGGRQWAGYIDRGAYCYVR